MSADPEVPDIEQLGVLFTRYLYAFEARRRCS